MLLHSKTKQKIIIVFSSVMDVISYLSGQSKKYCSDNSKSYEHSHSLKPFKFVLLDERVFFMEKAKVNLI